MKKARKKRFNALKFAHALIRHEEKLEKLEKAECEVSFCMHTEIDHGICMDCHKELYYEYITNTWIMRNPSDSHQ